MTCGHRCTLVYPLLSPPPQGPDRFRVLTAMFRWVVVSLHAATRAVASVTEFSALPTSDIVGLGELKAVTIVADKVTPADPGVTVVEVFGLLRDSSVLLFRSTFAAASAPPCSPVVRVLAKLAVSETVVAALCSVDKSILFAVLADMCVRRGRYRFCSMSGRRVAQSA